MSHGTGYAYDGVPIDKVDTPLVLENNYAKGSYVARNKIGKTHHANKVELIGQVTSDVHPKYVVRDGKEVMTLCYFYLKTDSYFMDNFGDEKIRSEVHKVISFGKSAAYVANKVSKGSFVSVDGEIKTNRWQNSDGKPRVNRDIKLNKINVFYELNGRDLNKVVLVGEVTDEPVIIKKSTNIASFYIKTVVPSRKVKEKPTDPTHYKIEVHKIIAFDLNAEYIEGSVKKGDVLSIEGEISSNSWISKSNGEKRKTKDIRVNIVNKVM